MAWAQQAAFLLRLQCAVWYLELNPGPAACPPARLPARRGQFYPGTGSVTEVGGPGAEGATLNVPWPCGGMRNGDYMAAFHHLILPVAHGGLVAPLCLGSWAQGAAAGGGGLRAGA